VTATWIDQIFEDIVETIRESLLVLDKDLKIDRRAGCMGNPLVRFCAGPGNN